MTVATTHINLFDRAVCIKVSLSRLGTRRKVSKGVVKGREEQLPQALVTVDADKELVHVAKDIIESRELQEIQSLDGEIRKYVDSMCLPSPLFKGGIYLLPVDLIEVVDERLLKLQEQRQELVEVFLRAYPEKVEDARRRLGGLFQATDYPPIERVRSAFAMSIQYISVGVPENLERINPTLFARETEKAARQAQDAVEEIVATLLAAAKECVTHMVERLTPGEDGKPKTFRNTLVTNLLDFLSTLPARLSVVADHGTAADLERMMQDVRELMRGVTPAALRDNNSIRDYVLNGVQRIKGQLDGLVVTRSTRAVAFEEDAA